MAATFTGIMELLRKPKPDCFLDEDERLDGKTVLIDGASSGLGFAVAVEVARRGAKVIMACRSGIPEKGELVKQLSGNSDIHMLEVDFSDISSILHLASGIRHQYAPIDIYICNAAIVPAQSRKTKDGLEEMFMVNYLSKFMFINLLIENNCFNLSAVSDHNPASGIRDWLPRIIIVSSESHRNPEKFDWDGFGKYKEYGMKKTVELYGYYKLMLTTFARELSRKLNPDGKTNISVFSLCPGPINSKIAREAPAIFQPIMRLVFFLFFRSPGKAAAPVIYFATSKETEGKPFDYLFLMNRKEISSLASDPENGKRLWEFSEEMRTMLDRQSVS